MEKQISFGNFIAHLIPGVVALQILLCRAPLQPPDWMSRNSIVLATAFFSVSLALGLFLDCLRYVLTKVLGSVPLVGRIHRYLKVPPPGEVARYDWIIENSWRHHQFSGNLSLAACLLFFLPADRIPRLLIGAVILVLAVAAVLIYKATVNQLNDAFPDNK